MRRTAHETEYVLKTLGHVALPTWLLACHAPLHTECPRLPKGGRMKPRATFIGPNIGRAGTRFWKPSPAKSGIARPRVRTSAS